jgi:hypothetical protein
MKVFLVTGILFFIVSSCRVSSSIKSVTKSQLEACETGQKECIPIAVSRSSKKQHTVVYFLIAAHETQIKLFDSSYLRTVRNKDVDSIQPIRQGFINIEDKPALDLTNLPDGKYYAHILGDDVGGVFEINLITDR